jgi:hypothetical protein
MSSDGRTAQSSGTPSHRTRAAGSPAGGSGGASGMLYFNDAHGRQFFIGGVNDAYAQHITDALNAMLQLVAQ